jgi:hypothetical protein
MNPNANIAWGTGIGSAISALKSGRRVRRAGWNNKGMWLSMTPGMKVNHTNFWSTNNAIFARNQPGQCAEVLPYITMKTADDKIVPWVCSQTDLLADDWEVIADE